ncbi:MAG: N-acetylmuramoyl-L-alanine amidase, partial [Phycisphaerae bacterium]|nr:N-acetylmuramoyl-L-alanine amidase [Phycisphaerae bacterium]
MNMKYYMLFFLFFPIQFIFAFSAVADNSEPKITAALQKTVENSAGIMLSSSSRPLFPAGSKVLAAKKENENITIDLSNKARPLQGEEFLLDLLQQVLINAASEAEPSLRVFHIRFEDEKGVVRPLDYFFPRETLPVSRISENRNIPPFKSRYSYQGALSGKRIFLSAGHGWYFGSDGLWHTQRGDTNGVIEDFLTATIMNYHLLPLLEKTGVEAIDTRERDMNTEEFIVDNQGAGFSIEGDWGDGSSTGGWDSESGGAPYRVSQVSADGASKAIFKPEITKAGWYGVYIWYVAGDNRVKDAEHIIRHSQGEAAFYVNQEINGSRWNYLGRFYFYPGGDNALIITNQSQEATDQYVIADAVRFGGGFGSIERNDATSGKPRWQECCRYYSQFSGAPDTVYNALDEDNSDDVQCRPRFSEWWGDGDAYVSVHTNAFNTYTTGTETFMHETELPEGSELLRDKINAQLVEDIRAEWDTDWVNRGTKTANFGELRLLSTMPGALTELAFHDGYGEGVNDNEYLKNPRFRRLCARAVVRGIIRYFDDSAPFPPPQIEALSITNAESGLSVNWGEVEGAQGYALYIGRRGRGFGEPVMVSAPPYAIENIPAGETVYAAVAAYNVTGEGYLSKVVGAKLAPAIQNEYKILLVDGFDRWDYSADEAVNTFDFSVEHIEAFPNGVSVDGATGTAV